jgi:branched-chain amino acid transport system ATP-binding protein
MLEVRGLHAWYGESHVLHGVDFALGEGEVVTLLGRNGAGKSTILKSIMGLLGHREGHIRFRGRELIGLRPDRVARAGIGYCPEERGVFASLSVGENLNLARVMAPGGLDLPTLMALFPNLAGLERRPGMHLSGGEQKMLAIARILRTGARLLLLDEPTAGLAPVLVDQIAATVEEIRRRGFTILLVEQNFRFAGRLADRHCVVENGRVVDMIARAELSARQDRLQSYLGV